jgi:hypothetical protein
VARRVPTDARLLPGSVVGVRDVAIENGLWNCALWSKVDIIGRKRIVRRCRSKDEASLPNISRRSGSVRSAAKVRPEMWPAEAVRNVRIVPILFSNESSGGHSDPERWCAAFGCLRSLRARRHLMGSAGCGVAWLQTQSAAWIDRMRQNRRHHPRPPSGNAPLGSSSRSPVCCRAEPKRV